jgi:tetratricopeptide (TPR) repeat protein
LIVRAKSLLLTGNWDEASRLVDEVLEIGRVDQADFAIVDLAWVASMLGRADELRPTFERLQPKTPWRVAALAVAAGDPRHAGDVLGRIGAVSAEAFIRLQAAEALVAAGRRQEADEQLQRALSFYRAVDASRYVRQGETLLAASA